MLLGESVHKLDAKNRITLPAKLRPHFAEGVIVCKGVDRCLSSGASCGLPIATAYCQSRDFKTVASFHKVDRGDITGAIPATNAACRAGACEEFVAIECSR